MSGALPDSTAPQARRRSEQTMSAVTWVTIGTCVAPAPYLVAAVPLDAPPPPPTRVWTVPALVGPAAPVIGGATLIAMSFAPRNGGRRERWGRDEAEDGDGA